MTYQERLVCGVLDQEIDKYSEYSDFPVSPWFVRPDAHRIHSRNKLEKYLRGAHICKSVAYVIGLEKIASYIEDLNMKEFHVIIGKEVSAAKHRGLDVELIEKLVFIFVMLIYYYYIRLVGS